MAQLIMGKFRQEGVNIDHTPSTAMKAGEVVVLSAGLVGVVPNDIAANTLGAVNIEGVWDLPKATGAGKDILVGEKAFWNVAGGVITQIASGSVPCGFAVATAPTDQAFVSVRLANAGVQGT